MALGGSTLMLFLFTVFFRSTFGNSKCVYQFTHIYLWAGVAFYANEKRNCMVLFDCVHCDFELFMSVCILYMFRLDYISSTIFFSLLLVDSFSAAVLLRFSFLHHSITHFDVFKLVLFKRSNYRHIYLCVNVAHSGIWKNI